MSAVVVLVLTMLVLGLMGVIAWITLRGSAAPVAQEPELSWELILPRGATFPIPQAAAWFSGLSSHLRPDGPHPSLEWWSEDRTLHLGITVPQSWEALIRGQFAAWFPGARLELRDAGWETREQTAVLPLRLAKPEIHPLRIPAHNDPEPLLGFFGALLQEDTVAGLDLTWGPPPIDWEHWAPVAVAAIKAGNKVPARDWRFTLTGLMRLLQRISANGVRDGEATPEVIAAEAKFREPVFTVSLELWTAATETAAQARLQALAAQLAVAFRHPFGNALEPLVVASGNGKSRTRPEPAPQFALTAVELAALFHLPSSDHPLIPGEPSRRVAPPPNILQIGADSGPMLYLGNALTPEGPVPFGLGRAERRLHTYVVGQTGTGKSTLLAGIAKQDLEAGRGIALIDPHGDLAERMLSFVPPERYHEVIYFNPADVEYPIAFNLLEVKSAAERPLVASGVVGVFKKLYADSWGPRLEYILRNACLALLETPEPSLLQLPRLLTDDAFRARCLEHVRDPVIRSFFLEEYESYTPGFRTEAIAPILNKVGAALSSPPIRNILGQSRSAFDLRQVMDTGGIFIANLASGRIGEDNTALLGGMLVSAFQLAAMRRADVPEAERRDFALVVDEFQHFAGDAFASILSEARKFSVSLVLAHQYLDQVPPEILDAVLGNVGSLCVFRVGPMDTVRLVRELAPSFDEPDLVHLPNHRFAARINRMGETVRALSGETMSQQNVCTSPPPIVASRTNHARKRTEVEIEINDYFERR